MQCCLTLYFRDLFLGMHDGLGDIACLLTTDTGDAGSSPHVAREVFSMMFDDEILLYM